MWKDSTLLRMSELTGRCLGATLPCATSCYLGTASLPHFYVSVQLLLVSPPVLRMRRKALNKSGAVEFGPGFIKRVFFGQLGSLSLSLSLSLLVSLFLSFCSLSLSLSLSLSCVSLCISPSLSLPTSLPSAPSLPPLVVHAKRANMK